MSVPLALIVKMPELEDEDPAGVGAPTSCASQGAGTAACTAVAAPQIAAAIRTDRRERSCVHNRMGQISRAQPKHALLTELHRAGTPTAVHVQWRDGLEYEPRTSRNALGEER